MRGKDPGMEKKVLRVQAPPSRPTKAAIALVALAIALPFGLILYLFG